MPSMWRNHTNVKLEGQRFPPVLAQTSSTFRNQLTAHIETISLAAGFLGKGNGTFNAVGFNVTIGSDVGPPQPSGPVVIASALGISRLYNITLRLLWGVSAAEGLSRWQPRLTAKLSRQVFS